MFGKISMGGGRTFVKSRGYIKFFFIISLFIVSMLVISSDFVFAGGKKTSSTKRASSTKKNNTKSSSKNKSSTKRAAVSTKRAATSSTTGTRSSSKTTKSSKSARAVSRGKSSRKTVVADNEPEVKETEKVKETVSLVCPVEKVISGRFDDDEFHYYSGKDLCREPENASAYKWDNSLKSKYPRGSVSESEAYYFACESNHIVKTVDNQRVCVSVFNSCPLGVVLEKSEKGYLSPETGDVCDLPVNSKARLVNDGENTRGDVDDNSAYIAECNANKYSAPIDGSGSDLHLQCLSCPTGYLSPVGSNSKDKCMEDCKDGKVAGDDGKCVSCDENATYSDGVCICKNGYYGKGYGTNGCVICPVGSICTGGEKKDVNKDNNEYMDKTGADKVKTCPAGSKSTGTSCTCDDSNYTFDINSNTCNVSKCNAGQILEGGKCVDCPAGYYCSGNNNKSACSAGTYNGSTGAKSADACVKCEDYHWSSAGASKCGKIKIHLWYSYWNDDNDVNKACTLNMNKWFETGTQVKASNDNFGGDPKKSKKKGAGAPCWHIASEGQTINLNCATLPCTIQGPNGRYLKVTADRTFECADGSGKFSVCSGGKSGSDLVKWD